MSPLASPPPKISLAVLGLALSLTGCHKGEPETAEAQLQSLDGKNIKGTIHFTQVDGAVAVQGTVEGLTAGKHGFHIHEEGDCSAKDFISAGGHFNPAGVQHGGPSDDKHHIGDLGNVEVGPGGKTAVSITMPALSLDEGDKGSIVGRAVVVHAGEDDLKSQPGGDAGARVACGVITRAALQP